MKKRFILVLFIILCFFAIKVKAAPWGSFFSDVDYWWKDATGDIYFPIGSIGINMPYILDHDYEFDVSGDGHFWGSLSIDGGFDVSGDGTFDNLTVIHDISADSGVFWVDSGNDTISTTGDASFDRTLRVGGDATFDNAVDIAGVLTGTDATFDGNIHQTSGDSLYTDQIRAIDGDGLKLTDDDGNGLFIEDGGNVGIGTTTPYEALHVKGSAVNSAIMVGTTDYNDTDTGSRIILGLGATTGDTFSTIQAQDVGGSSSANLVLQRYSGNVGIGNEDPNSILHISSTAPIQIIENTTEENTSGGRRSVINMVGFRADGTEDVLGQIATSHNGAGADGRGKVTISVSDSSGTLLNAFDASSDGSVTFNYDTYMGGLAFEDDAGEVNLYSFGVSADSTTDTVHSVTLPIDGEAILTVAGDSSGDGTIKNKRTELHGDTGTIKLFVYQEDNIADDSSINLPAATNGMVFVSMTDSSVDVGGMWGIQEDGGCIKISGTTTYTADSSTDNTLCVYDGGTYGIISNRMDVTGDIQIFYYYY